MTVILPVGRARIYVFLVCAVPKGVAVSLLSFTFTFTYPSLPCTSYRCTPRTTQHAQPSSSAANTLTAHRWDRYPFSSTNIAKVP